MTPSRNSEAGRPVAGAQAGRRTRLPILDEDDDDPVLSTINLIDVFLVVIGMLLIAVIDNPFNPFAQDSVTVIRRAGQPDMEIIQKQGETVTRYRAGGGSAEGNGEKVGTAYRMKDGTLIYVPTEP